MKKLFLFLLYMMLPLNIYASETIRVLALTSNSLYGHAKFDILSGIKTKLKHYGYDKIVIKTLSFDENFIEYSFIKKQIDEFNPNFIIIFDSPKIEIKYNVPIYEIKLYNVPIILEKIKTIFKNSNIKPKKVIVLYDDYVDVEKSDLDLIKTTLNADLINIKTINRLREVLFENQKQKDIVFITLLRRLYDIDSNMYLQELFICKEFQNINFNNLEIAFKYHTYKFNIAISIGQDNIQYGENIVSNYLFGKNFKSNVFLNINERRLNQLNYDDIIHENFSIIENIYNE